MKKMLTVLMVSVTIAISSLSFAGVHEDHPYDYTISKDIYKMSEIYQIKSIQKETYPGSIKKSMFRIRTNYDLSDKHGWQATGIIRLLSPGAIFPWATDIDIYDTRGVKFGLIDGSAFTVESAKFHLYEYDDFGNSFEVGVAFANPDFSRFVIYPLGNNPHPIAEMSRDYNNKTWNVSVHYPEILDDRIMRIFSGFVVDFQDKFLSETEDDIADVK
ncbi:MAG: hypothetical protein JJT82_00810 [Legionellaceae bacterium]|nr:hypothetical protein [Legionellaceae bacterium]